MKIGILTLPLHTNYGGILQAYALQTVLEKMGHEAEIINIPFVRPSASLLVKIKRIIKTILGTYTGYISYEEESNKWLPIASENINSFVKKNLRLSKLYDSCSEIKENDYDCICVGSDQIWRPKMLILDISNAYLSFAEHWNIKRFAYSASFGTDIWEYSDDKTKRCKDLVKLFNGVSVREGSGIELCRNYLGISALQTLDPTLLLDSRDYDLLLGGYEKKRAGKILFSYVLDVTNEKKQLIEEYATSKGMIISKIDVEMGNKKCDISKRVLPSVEFWLNSFRISDFIITDSFHACVFSIIYKKQFAVIVNKARGADRFHSLLSNLELEDRIVNDIKDINCLKTIDFASVYDKLNEQKQYSYNYLKEIL